MNKQNRPYALPRAGEAPVGQWPPSASPALGANPEWFGKEESVLCFSLQRDIFLTRVGQNWVVTAGQFSVVIPK